MSLKTLLLLLSVACAAHGSNGKVVICYHGSWAIYRPGLGKFEVDNINPFLCTHIMYTFAGIDDQGTAISLDPDLDLVDGQNNFGKFTALKNVNPKLKTLISVGGWGEGSAKYSTMAARAASRQNFTQSILQMIREYGFDGLDLDWEYPNQRDSVYGEADIDNFTQLLKELKEEFDKYGLILTAAVAATEGSASLSYDIPSIVQYLDYVNLMTYDMHGAWDPVTGHNAALHAGESGDPFTVDVCVEYWLSQGAPPEKLVLGLPFYGRTFTLTNASEHGVGAPASGAGISGPYTGESGIIGYNEFCDILQTESWTIVQDVPAKVPYAYEDVNWVTYDDADSIKAKVEFALDQKLAGVMMWSIETDDFNNVCGREDFPLLKTINDTMNATSSSSLVSVLNFYYILLLWGLIDLY